MATYDTEMEIICLFCKGKNTVHYNKVDMSKWIEGTLIQNAFPYLDAGDRELLQSKMCGNCWDETFGEGTYGKE